MRTGGVSERRTKDEKGSRRHKMAIDVALTILKIVVISDASKLRGGPTGVEREK